MISAQPAVLRGASPLRNRRRGFGFDIYGARVTLTNTGQTSIQVTPEKLQIVFGDEAASVFVADDPRFLKPTLLRPGQAASGLVMSEARVDIGAAIRLGEGEMSYVDPNLDVVEGHPGLLSDPRK